jgi:3-hydroxyisobutyrate dehydrogenase-like beta-hydroxyacid dehydrogenase
MTDVTVIGLGQMGARLAELMLNAGKSVTVWNRSAEKAAGVVAAGATLARDPASAIAAGGLTLICVYDYKAAQAILDQPGATSALAGRILVNLGTGGPEEAKAAEAFVLEHGGAYLDGAIQAAPSQMGQPDTPILVSGQSGVFDDAKAMLNILGGGLVYLGDAIDAAAYMDLATLSYVYGAFAGFLHGARIAEVKNISVKTFGTIVKDISPSFGAFFAHEGGVIASGDFAVTESPMRISVSAVERILRSSEALGLNSELPRLVNGWLGRAVAAGHSDEELAAVIKVLR